MSNALLATVTNGASTGDASIILNGGQASNTGAGHGASALNAGTGNAAVTLAGGSVSSNTGIGLRAIVSNAAGTASVAIGGGTVTTASGTGVLSQAELGSSGITMTGGTVTVQGGASPALNAVVNNAAGTGTASIVMSGGTVTNNGSGDGLFANNKGTGTYTVSLTGGTVTGGAGTGAAIRGEAAGGGTITVRSAAVVNAGASGIALNQAGGAAAITTAGTVSGDINLSAAADTLDILGGTIDGNIGGGGNSALDFDLGLGSFTYGSAYAIADMDSIAMTSGSAWIEGTLNTNTLNLNGGALHLNGTATAAGGAMVAVGGSLFGTGILNGNVTNAGIIAPGNSIGTLTINGDYAGAGGLLEIETMLGDDSSATDRLIVTGDTSGSTNVHVTNVGGAGGQTVEGIKIVDVGGASNGSFSLLGDYVFEGEQAVVGGAYAYRLYQGGISTPLDGDWYLRSALIDGPDPEPLFQAGAPLYEVHGNVPQQSFASLETLQQRTGRRSSGTAGGEGEGLWGRIVANHAHFSPESSTTGASYDVTTWRLQAGADGIISQSEAGELVGGLNVEFGTISADVASIYGDGSISSLGFGGGGTLTYGGTGFYLDAQAQVKGFSSTLNSATAGLDLVDGNAGFGYGFSLEAGQKVALGDEFSITPQAQLAYSSVRFDAFEDAFGADVSLGGADRLIGRLGLSADYETEWTDPAGEPGRTHLYGIANLYYDFGDGAETEVEGVSLASHNDPLWTGIGLGGSINWAGDRLSLHGEAHAGTSLGSFADSFSLGATAGIRGKL